MYVACTERELRNGFVSS